MKKLEQKFQDIIKDNMPHSYCDCYPNCKSLCEDKGCNEKLGVTSKSVELTKEIAVKFAQFTADGYWRSDDGDDYWIHYINDRNTKTYTTEQLFNKFLETL